MPLKTYRVERVIKTAEAQCPSVGMVVRRGRCQLRCRPRHLDMGQNYEPPRSLDRNPLGFFFWYHLKLPVYETPVATVENLTAWIVVSSTDIANTPDLFE
ncbi:hypothetical protein TNCV_1010411 [Trichonephila clavipes]|nr:hypothetical protein TNCV_1010411 [Trichonephila clavipes]